MLVSALGAFESVDVRAMDKMMRRYNPSSSLATGGSGLHIVFCVDESYSMQGSPWKVWPT